MSTITRFGRVPLAVIAAGMGLTAFGLVPASAADGDEFPVTYAPGSGPTGTSIHVSGTGCIPPADGNGATVRVFLVEAGAASILLDPVVPGDADADANGAFDFDVIADHDFMPQLPPFLYSEAGDFKCSEFAAGGGFFDKYSDFDFEVTLPAALPASTGTLTLPGGGSAQAGTAVTVTGPGMTNFDEGEGDGYVPNQAVKFVLYPGAVLLGEATAGSDTPAVSTSVTIPAGTAPGSYTIVGFGDYQTVAPSFTALTVPVTVTAGATTTSSTTTSTSTSTSTSSTSTSTSTTSSTSTTTSTTATTLPTTTTSTSTTTSTTATTLPTTTSSTASTATTAPGGSTTTTTAAFVPPGSPPEGAGPIDTMSTASLPAGGSLTITDDGFVPGESVPVVLYSDPVLLKVATADATGKVTTTVTVPANTPIGSHTVVLYGSQTAKKAPVTVTAAAQVTSTTTATTAAPSSTLVRTGSNAASERTGFAGVGLVVFGTGLVLAGRHRRDAVLA